MKMNSTQKLSMRGFRGHFPHYKTGILKKNRRSRFRESPFLGTVPTPLETSFFTIFFYKGLFHKIFVSYWIAGIETFQKSNICPKK